MATKSKPRKRKPRKKPWWMRSKLDDFAIKQGYYFDEAAAERAREFFERFLVHSKGQWAGKPFILLPWQYREVIGPIFGWKTADGRRRFRSGYVEIGKKNGKSTLAAGLALAGLVFDLEPGAEIYTAAADRDQASIIFREAANMVRASKMLSSRCVIVDSRKQIAYPENNAFLKALSADVPTKEGLNAHMVLFDELHTQRSRALWDTLLYAGASRREPLMLAFTTAGFDRNSICWEIHKYAEAVIEGSIEDLSFLAVIHAAGEKDNWKKPKAWKKANPSLGVTVSVESMRHDCKRAQASLNRENTFKRYRLSIWTEQATRWLRMENWDACGAEFGIKELYTRPCFGGMDLASTQDIAAFVLVFPPESGELLWHLLPWFWIPAENALKREKHDRVPYRQWERDGYIEMTEGNVIDYDLIRRRIGEIREDFDIREIACDRWNATQIITQLSGDGFTIFPIGQGFRSMTAPSKKLEELVLSKRLRHGGHPVLRWMAANVSVETDAAGNLKPSKKVSTQKIDGITAALNAIGRALVDDSGGVPSIYDDRGVMTI